jgi:hypothetical protein
VTSSAHAARSVSSAHLRAIVRLIRAASRYFPRDAPAEIVASATPGLSHTNAHVCFNSLAFLFILLPPWVGVGDLPPGTPAWWLRVWGFIDHCAEWDALWAAIFAQLARPDAIVDGGAEGGEGAPGAFPWGAALPFFAARLQSALRLPVAGGEPYARSIP